MDLPFSIAHGSSTVGGSEDWPNDDRVLVRTDIGLFAVADALGPTYGGWHEPLGVSIGLEELCRVWEESPQRNEICMRQAFSSAKARMFDPSWMDESAQALRRGRGRLRHATASITALGIGRDQIVVGQVGTCRAYALRPAPQLLVPEHSLPALDADMREALPSRLLGLQPDVSPDAASFPFLLSDVYLLCTDGVWLSLLPDRLAALAAIGDPVAAATALTSEAGASSGDATALVIRCGTASA